MAIQKIPREQLNLTWELGFERLEGYTRLALSSQKQAEVSTNAYYALMMALHWLEITELGYKTTCHTERIETELKTTLSGLKEAGIIDERREKEAWIIFYYWIVGYWDGDPGSAHVKQVQNVLASFLGFFFGRLGQTSKHAPEENQSRPLTEEALSTLFSEVKRLYDTLDVGEW